MTAQHFDSGQLYVLKVIADIYVVIWYVKLPYFHFIMEYVYLFNTILEIAVKSKAGVHLDKTQLTNFVMCICIEYTCLKCIGSIKIGK